MIIVANQHFTCNQWKQKRFLSKTIDVKDDVFFIVMYVRHDAYKKQYKKSSTILVELFICCSLRCGFVASGLIAMSAPITVSNSLNRVGGILACLYIEVTRKWHEFNHQSC